MYNSYPTWNQYKGKNEGIVFVIGAQDGRYMADAMEITLSTDSGEKWLVGSNGLTFDRHEKVYLAFEMMKNYRYRWNLCPGCLGNIQYQARLTIGKYDYVAGTMNHIYEQ